MSAVSEVDIRDWEQTKFWPEQTSPDQVKITKVTPQGVYWEKVVEQDKTSVDAILDERGKRYGTFTGHAAIAQLYKQETANFLTTLNKVLANDQQEALDMIFHKIGRIINGDPNYADSWVDIAGYAKLVADRLEGKVR